MRVVLINYFFTQVAFSFGLSPIKRSQKERQKTMGLRMAAQFVKRGDAKKQKTQKFTCYYLGTKNLMTGKSVNRGKIPASR